MRSPFFILGTGRCGSTYLYSMLDRHPRIALTNEAGVFDFLHMASQLAAVPECKPVDMLIHEPVRLHGMVSGEHTAVWSQVFDRHALAAVEDFYAVRFAHKPFTRWGDKLPDPYAALAAQAAYPDLRHVVLIRDPRDVLCSYRSFAARPDVLERNPFLAREFSLLDFCGSWRNFYESGMRYLRDPLLVRYEDLVTEPRAQVRRVLEFLEVEADDAHCDLAAPEGLFAEHGTSKSPAASIGRWKVDLTAEEVAQLESELGPLLRTYGYAPSLADAAPRRGTGSRGSP